MKTETILLRNVFALALILAMTAMFAAWPTPARADLFMELQSLFEGNGEADPNLDPYLAVHDLFVTKAQDAKAQGNLPLSLEYLKIAATAMPQNRATFRQADELRKQLQAMAAKLADSAGTDLDNDQPDQAMSKLLKALRQDPSQAKAWELLHQANGRKVMNEYEIQKGDTLESIANKVYGNPGALFLITKINKLNMASVLTPGKTLRLPVVPAKLTKRIKVVEVAAAPEPSPVRPRVEAVAPSGAAPAAGTKTADQMAMLEEPLEDAEAEPAMDTAGLLTMARMQFGQRLYDTVISMSEEVLATEPDNAEATQMLRESYYQLSVKYEGQGNDLQAAKHLMRIPDGYKDSAKRLEAIKAKLLQASEPHYLAGVNHFINEDLEQAVLEWETALQINPFHAKAAKDMEKAKQILETVRKIQ